MGGIHKTMNLSHRMEFAMIERLHLEILREVDRLGTLTKAAAALCLTQSALSHSIKKLETALNLKIWRKEGRHLHLTEAGKDMLVLAKRILPQLGHFETLMTEYALGQRGTLRIGMECHPCYQWMVKIVPPFLKQWPNVEIDVKQKFQFGGLGALYQHEIDLLITPDPLIKPGIDFHPVFDYELVLVVPKRHALARLSTVLPEQLVDEILMTYPVPRDRLDIFSQFFNLSKYSPKKHKTFETTDIMMQMVEAGRGITALPNWLVADYESKMAVKAVRIGKKGIQKKLYIGTRDADNDIAYIKSFKDLARK
ncbi:MAG: LysR family transcriptional regulator for metE and metH [Candidatus Marinamargulisbacteria bacterium]|jgi:LysR family transcriptional regulator for metE and metH